MSKRPSHEELFARAVRSAMRKQAEGQKLKPSEEVASKGEWFFSMALPWGMILDIKKIAEERGVKPYIVAREWVEKGLKNDLN